MTFELTSMNLGAKRISATFVDITIFMAGVFIIERLVENFTYLYSLLFILAINGLIIRDLFSSISIGRALFGLQLRFYEQRLPLPYILLRNLTFVFWPIELYLVLSDKPRVGDRISRTKIVIKDSDDAGRSIREIKLQWKEILWTCLLILTVNLVLIFFSIFFGRLTSEFTGLSQEYSW